MRKIYILIISTIIISCKSEKKDPLTVNKNQIEKKQPSKASFKFELDDTLYLGPNTGKITDYQTANKTSEYLLSVIIENKYEDGEIVKDTFSDGTLNPWFGVYANEPGRMKVKGIILEEAIKKNYKNNDSIVEIARTSMHFTKQVFVLDSVNKK